MSIDDALANDPKQLKEFKERVAELEQTLNFGNFEQKLQQIETITNVIADPNISLSEMIASFEISTKLINEATAQLNAAKAKVEILNSDKGELEEFTRSEHD